MLHKFYEIIIQYFMRISFFDKVNFIRFNVFGEPKKIIKPHSNIQKSMCLCGKNTKYQNDKCSNWGNCRRRYRFYI